MEILEGLASVAEGYDGFVLDLWGVVHDGTAPYPGVVDTLAQLRATGKRVVFLSNAPRRGHVVASQLRAMGVSDALYDGIITSGELAWRNLRERSTPWFEALGERAFHIGPDRDRSVIEDLPITLVDSPSRAEFVLNTGPDPRRGPLSVAPYEETLEACAGLGLPMLCCNPDRAVMVSGERLICAGALSERYREMGGDSLELGKPDAAAYPPVMEMLGLRASRVLAIGDSPHTDLAGAQAAGIDSLWALTGLAGDAYGPDPAPALLDRVVAEQGGAPKAALRSLRW